MLQDKANKDAKDKITQREATYRRDDRHQIQEKYRMVANPPTRREDKICMAEQLHTIVQQLPGDVAAFKPIVVAAVVFLALAKRPWTRFSRKDTFQMKHLGVTKTSKTCNVKYQRAV